MNLCTNFSWILCMNLSRKFVRIRMNLYEFIWFFARKFGYVTNGLYCNITNQCDLMIKTFQWKSKMDGGIWKNSQNQGSFVLIGVFHFFVETTAGLQKFCLSNVFILWLAFLLTSTWNNRKTQSSVTPNYKRMLY